MKEIVYILASTHYMAERVAMDCGLKKNEYKCLRDENELIGRKNMLCIFFYSYIDIHFVKSRTNRILYLDDDILLYKDKLEVFKKKLEEERKNVN